MQKLSVHCPSLALRGGAVWLLLLAVAIAVCGCGEAESSSEDEFAAELPELGPTKSAPATPDRDAPAVSLDLRLGQTFAFHRTVEQVVTQDESSSRAQIDLWMIIEVDDVARDGRARLAVQFERVAYQRALENDVLQYDSRRPPEHLPLELRPWHGLRGNRFSFWLGPDGELQELVGFETFLERTLAGLPLVSRQSLMARWTEEFGRRGLAELVDESIGLLAPPEKTTGEQGERTPVRLKPGWKFTRTQRLEVPVAAVATSTWRVTSLEETLVQMELRGDIRPASLAVQPVHAETPTVSIRRGHSVGQCVIDLRSGLPLESSVERFVDMVVHLADGVEVDQHKRTVITVRRLDAEEARLAGLPVSGEDEIAPPPPRRLTEGGVAPPPQDF